MTILMRPIFVPLGEAKTGGKPLPVIVSTEWHRTIEQLVQAVNGQQALLSSLSQLTSAEIAELAALLESSEAVATQQYATRYDQDADPPTFAYLGQALPGTATSAAGWRIQRLTFSSDGDVSTQWADGNSDFDNVWNDRATLTYS